MSKPRPPDAPSVPYLPPQPTFTRCSGCDTLVLPGPVSPVTGTPHACDEALAWRLRTQGVIWGAILAPWRGRETQEVR
jgi:hypothetical protein